MSDPTRLLASPETTDLERELLQSWVDERPSRAAYDKTLARLAVSGGAIGAGAIVSASVAPKAIAAGWLATLKWIVVSAVVLAMIGVGVTVATRRHAPLAVQATPQAIAAPVTKISDEAAPVVVASNVVPTTSATARKETFAPPHPAASASLADQIAALDRARVALDSGDTRGARKLADAYEVQYPDGVLTQEADVVRIDALVREGNRDDAKRAMRSFVVAYPKSPHVARLRALVGDDP
ncbi:MAG TPA: hypothetical protein VGH87_20055 [Polyangiaceae bacterium]|jgi:hypothetical protein